MAPNPPDLRPDLARARVTEPARPEGRARQPTIGMVSLGCPKALVDSERILTRLRAEGYAISSDYAGADAVVVNTCGFLDSAKAESPEAIGEALAQNGRVIVTGCLGAEPAYITRAHPRVLAVTGPNRYAQGLDAVHAAVAPAPDPFVDLLPASGLSLTPRHDSYLKISEGCNHTCKFCVIPDMRGKLASRPHRAVLCEAEKPVENDVRELELLVISQDTSAYGTDWPRADRAGPEQPITRLARDLGSLGAGVRLHDVYPQSDVRKLIPPMAEGGGAALPGHPLPACLDRIAEWRRLCPDITLRVTFIVGYRGEIAAEVQHLLDRLDEAQPDRVGCFRYENVAGVRSNALPDHVPAEVKQDRWDRIMEKARANFGAKLAAKVGRTMEVIVDDIDEDGIATCRTRADAPETDGNLFIDAGTEGPSVGEIVRVEVDEAGEHDLRGCLASRD